MKNTKRKKLKENELLNRSKRQQNKPLTDVNANHSSTD